MHGRAGAGLLGLKKQKGTFVEPVRNPKLSEVIAGHIEQMILEGSLRPGERLAPERELAEKLEVSRPPLRDAIEMLSAKGLLKTTHSGTFVTQFMAPLTNPLASLLQSNPQVIFDYFEFRKLIEGPTAGLAAERATDLDRKAIRECLEQLQAAHGLDDPTPEAERDADLHMLVYEASHNLVVTHIMRAFSDLLRADVFYSRHKLYVAPGARDILLAQHLAIGEAVIAGDVERAERSATEHIRFTAETLERLKEEELRVGRALRRLGRAELLGR